MRLFIFLIFLFLYVIIYIENKIRKEKSIMRLWHQSLIPLLPRQQLLGQHRECCALRGNGWGRKHATVDYVFKYSPNYLIAYHYLIMEEMLNRGYNPDPVWKNPNWRGSSLGEQKDWADKDIINLVLMTSFATHKSLYPEHNNDYLQECLDNLKSKGIEIPIINLN
jgi:uncharacterized protein (TIGR02328 family)